MFALELRGLEETSAQLSGYPAALQAALSAKAAELAAASPTWSRTTSLPGPC